MKKATRTTDALTSDREGTQWTWSFAVIVGISATGYWGFLSTGGAGKYAVIFAVSLLAIALDGRFRGITSSSKSARTQLLCGIYGIYIVGIYVVVSYTISRPQDTFVIALGALLLVSGPIAYQSLPARHERPTNSKTARLLLILVSTAFGVLGIVDVLRAPVNEPPSFFNHESIFVAVLVLTLPSITGLIVAKLAVLIALALSFVHYPAATAATSLCIAGITFYTLKRFSAKRRVRVMWIVAIASAPILSISSTILHLFYEGVGRVDNSQTRQLLWSQALRTLEDDVLFGSLGQDRITAFAIIRGTLQPVPFHNSYLTLAVYGGLIATGLFVLILARSLHVALLSTGDLSISASHWAPALITASLVMTVNPVIDSATTSIPLYILVLVSVFDQGTKTYTRIRG